MNALTNDVLYYTAYVGFAKTALTAYWANMPLEIAAGVTHDDAAKWAFDAAGTMIAELVKRLNKEGE